MQEEKKKITPGKWMGVISFFYILFHLILDKIIIIINSEINIDDLYRISLLSYFVFMIIWGAVFGSGAIKKIKNNENINV